MADTKLSALTELAATPAANDEIYIRDVSEVAADESKRILISNLMAAIIAHGADKHTDVTRWLFLLANGGVVLPGTPAQGPTLYGGVAGAANGANDPTVFFTFKVPDDFVSFSSLKAVWACGAASGDMLWRLLCYYASSGESYNTHSDVPAYAVTANGGADVINVQEPANALTLSNLAKGDYIGMEFTREGSSGSDTLDEEMNLLGILFTYVAEQ